MFCFTFGGVGSGKSIRQAQQVKTALARSIKIQEKYKLPIRRIACNFHIKKSVADKYADRFFVWHDPLEMIFEDYPTNEIIRRDFDCFWDEIAVELPSDKWESTHPEIRRFFAQHRKRGVEIYANTQDYMMLDVNARRMTTSVFKTMKIIGSRDPSSTLPPLKTIWGLIMTREIDKNSITSDVSGTKAKPIGLPSLMWIDKQLTSFYDTTEDISAISGLYCKGHERICKVCGKKTTH